MNTVYISLGSNIEPRATYLQQAVKQLASHENIEIVKTSSIYETEPVDYIEQSKFLNMVIEIQTSLSAHELLRTCQKVEDDLGRERKIDKGPRTIDLDILLFNHETIHEVTLQVPHPRMTERAFVLVPLNEIAPDKEVPFFVKTVRQLVDELAQIELDGVVFWREFFV